jgi:hypothetical protein
LWSVFVRCTQSAGQVTIKLEGVRRGQKYRKHFLVVFWRDNKDDALIHDNYSELFVVNAKIMP